jgi:hypothetical protein
MMRVAGFAALLLLGGCALSSAARPTPDPAQDEILAASLLALRASLSGELVIDPRIAAYDVRPGQSWTGSWPGAQVQGFAELLGGRVAELEEVRECSFPWLGQTPREQGCVMRDADVHLALSRPVVRGDLAAVVAYANADQSSARLRESVRVIRLELRRQAGEWSVRSSRVIAAM